MSKRIAFIAAAGLVVTSGTRKHEMALRLSYAGVPDEALASVDSVAAALRLAAERHAHSVYLLPTYTALKEVRGVLADWEAVCQWAAHDGRRRAAFSSRPSTSTRPR